MPTPSRPNLLLITTDQQRFDTLHAAGNDALFTPHLNWLADTGIRFRRCYSDAPVCAPARATIMTGQHAWHHGQVSNSGAVSPMADRPTLPGLLTAAGYQTRLVGKAHFKPTRAHYGFEHMELLPDYYRWAARAAGVRPPKNHGVGENEMEPVAATTAAEHSLTHWTVARSIDFLETRDPTRPFFLWTSFAKPHPPFDAPAEFFALLRDLPLPPVRRGDWSATPDEVPAGFRESTWHLNNVHRFSPAQLDVIRRAYHACIAHIDYTLGLLFARLRELNLLEHTWIVFTSDHGEMLGDHHLGAKSVFLEGSAHVPLLVRPPAGGWVADERAGTVDDRLACLADLLPSFLDWAGLEAPAPLATDGLSLTGTRRRTELVGQCGPYHSLFAGDHVYHFAEHGAGELCFDLGRDPLESHDLVRDPAAAATVQTLRARLATHLAGRGHPASVEGQLVATAPAPTEAAVRRRVWPGFHHPTDADCDLLH
jgi:arylsulfatase